VDPPVELIVESEHIRYETIGPIARITLDRSGKLNAIDAGMLAGLDAALDRAEADDKVRAVLLVGAGRSFSAGFDLAPSEGPRSVSTVRAELRHGFNLILRFWNCPKPTIAAVHGHCLGSGMELALACDLTIAAQGTRFGAPEVRFGSGILMLILPWLIGAKAAKALLLTGDDTLDAERALGYGLVSEVVPAADVPERALALARRIAGNDRIAVALTKQALNRSYDVAGMRAALEQAFELDVLIETSDSPEARAFNEILRRDGVKAAIAWREAQTARLFGDQA
jgi:enoyl-CoA hydratase/carnithine racemase